MLVGGSGLYVRAAIDDLDFPGTDPEIRARLEAELAERGPAPLYERLRPLAIRLRFWHPDQFLERTLPLVHWLVGWRGGVLWMIVVLPANRIVRAALAGAQRECVGPHSRCR